MSRTRRVSKCCSLVEYVNSANYRNSFADHMSERRRLWHEVDILNLPTSPCCYVIYFDGKLGYIGSTDNLRARLAKHIYLKPDWRLLNIKIKAKFPRRFGEWAMTEIRLIRRLKPNLNKNGKITRGRAICM